MLMVLKTLLNAWLRHVARVDIILHSRLIEVVPGMELLSLVIGSEIVWCYSNLCKEEGCAQDPFITDTRPNTVCYNHQQCSNLRHGVVDQIRYGLNSDRVWQRADADQMWMIEDYNTSVTMMRDAWTDLWKQMIDYGLISSLCLCCHFCLDLILNECLFFYDGMKTDWCQFDYLMGLFLDLGGSVLPLQYAILLINVDGVENPTECLT